LGDDENSGPPAYITKDIIRRGSTMCDIHDK
jgi:hypothetical protein